MHTVYTVSMNNPVLFDLSATDSRPMYLQIMDQIKHRIAIGDWPPGFALPSIRGLAAELRVSVITVKRAYLELEREAAIITQQGKGSFVAERPGIQEELRRKDLLEHLIKAVELATTLGIDRAELKKQLVEVMEQTRKK